MFSDFFQEIETTILNYQNATTQQRISILSQISLVLTQKKREMGSEQQVEIELLMKYLALVATLLCYAEILDKIENQGFFQILPDFYQMPLSKELRDYFEFGAHHTMRLLKKPQHIPLEIYHQFRQAQYQHLSLTGKKNRFYLDELNIEHPPSHQWYPIQIQMFARLNNQAVDRVQMNKNGLFKLARRYGKFVLPGGGMLEPDLKLSKQVKLEKMLEEHVEEQQSNFHLTGRLYIDAIDTEYFLEQCEIELNRQSHEYLNQLNFDENDMLLIKLNKKLLLPSSNSQIFIEMMDILDHSLLEISNEVFRRSILQLKSGLQWTCFKMTPLYMEALRLVQQHSTMIEIPIFLDCRVLGGFQYSNTFLQKGELLEDWFKQKLGGKTGLLGDDLTGSSYVEYDIWQALSDYTRIPHLLNLVVYQIVMLNAPEAKECMHKWDETQYLKAIQSILNGCQQWIESLMKR